jgi:hypothetical protein
LLPIPLFLSGHFHTSPQGRLPIPEEGHLKSFGVTKKKKERERDIMENKEGSRESFGKINFEKNLSLF